MVQAYFRLFLVQYKDPNVRFLKYIKVYLLSSVKAVFILKITVCDAQISRLLVVDPALRLTAEQALAHPFFRLYQKDVRLFSPRRTFRVRCIIRLHFI